MCPFNWSVFQQNCRIFLKTYLLEASKLFCIQTRAHTHTHTHISTILHNNPTNHSALCYLQTLSLLMAFLGHLCSRLWSPKHETSLVAQMVKHLLTMKETQVQSLGWEDLLEREMATHSSILGWKIP